MRFGLFIALLALLIPSANAAHFVVSPGESIQAAIDNASPRDVIEVESGIYRENVNVDKPLTLRGLGMPTVDADGNGSAITLSADGITVEGFNATTNSWDAGIEITSDYNIIKGNNAHANRFYGIFLYKSSNNNIEDNSACRNNKGIYISKSSNNTIKGNNIADNDDEGIFLWSSNNNIIECNNATYNKRRWHLYRRILQQHNRGK